MGIPKFYRWMSERYPCLSQVVREYQIPEFDNLYLDMNGIIHQCSHPDDNNPHFRISEEQIFTMIGHYIEVLFKIIKPRKYFFMAIDGVAPRAKMNQQRARRYRTAREAMEMEKKAREKGELLPETPRFDSNCITPGTVFMSHLHDFLQKFIAERITNDASWQDVRVILSGHDVPGEGEHKVMDFIRYLKSDPNYDPTTRHCLYGLDADLIMLGLTSHEPNFALLREEVRFGKQTKRVSVPEEQTFHLLHLSLLREYMDHEFAELKQYSNYDLESVIDDFVLICFLIGNDFIPHLPNLHIHLDGLTKLFSTYIDWQRSTELSGYLNEKGALNLARFESFVRCLDAIEREHYAEEYADFGYLEGKRAGERGYELPGGQASSQKPKAAAKPAQRGAFDQLAGRTNMDDPRKVERGLTAFFDDGEEGSSGSELGGAREPESGYTLPKQNPDVDDDEYDEMEEPFIVHKRNYYHEKFGSLNDASAASVRQKAREYVCAVQWILSYYYDGIPSWSWFYPFHYAPFICDLRDFANEPVRFDLSAPFAPYEQLMSVLPPASASLLPTAYRELMLDNTSTISDFYPLDFRTDLNGKRQDWEAVVLIPFIDERRLLHALQPLQATLSELERLNNRRGEHLQFSYRKSAEESIDAAGDVVVERFAFDAFHVPRNRLRKGLLVGSSDRVRLMPSFPSIRYVPHRAQLRRERVRVFQQESRGDNMILFVPRGATYDPPVIYAEYEARGRALLGTVVHVRWPHAVKALVTSVTLTRRPIRFDAPALANVSGGVPDRAARGNCRTVTLDEDEVRERDRRIREQLEHYMRRYGVSVGADAEQITSEEGGPPVSAWANRTEYLLEVRAVMGYRSVARNHTQLVIEPIWNFQTESTLFETCITERALRKVIVPEHADVVKTVRIREHFPIGGIACLLTESLYGEQVRIIGYERHSIRVQLMNFPSSVSLNDTLNGTVNRDPDELGVRTLRRALDEELNYLDVAEVARRVGPGVTGHFVARVTGTVYVRMTDLPGSGFGSGQQMNVGLGLRFTKRNQIVDGYTQMAPRNNRITFSPRVVELLREYRSRFPLVFEYLLRDTSRDDFTLDDVVRSWPANLDPLVILRGGKEDAAAPASDNRKARRRLKKQQAGVAIAEYADGSESDDELDSSDEADSQTARRRAATRVCIAELSRWIKSLPYNASPNEFIVPNGSQTSPPQIVSQIEQRAIVYSQRKRDAASSKAGNRGAVLTVMPTDLYRSTKETSNLVPDRHALYYLLDRVVCARSTTAVEFGARGTVIALIHSDKIDELTFEVLFDDEFRGGLRLRGVQSPRVYRFSGPSGLINLSHGFRTRIRSLADRGIETRTVRSFDWQGVTLPPPVAAAAAATAPVSTAAAPATAATVAAPAKPQPSLAEVVARPSEKPTLTGRGPGSRTADNANGGNGRATVAIRMLQRMLPKDNSAPKSQGSNNPTKSSTDQAANEQQSSGSMSTRQGAATTAAAAQSTSGSSDFQSFLRLIGAPAAQASDNAAAASATAAAAPATAGSNAEDNASKPTARLTDMLRNAKMKYNSEREGQPADVATSAEPAKSPSRQRDAGKNKRKDGAPHKEDSAKAKPQESTSHAQTAHPHVTNVALKTIQLDELFRKPIVAPSASASVPAAESKKAEPDVANEAAKTQPPVAVESTAVPKAAAESNANSKANNTTPKPNKSAQSSKPAAVVAPLTPQTLFSAATRHQPPQMPQPAAIPPGMYQMPFGPGPMQFPSMPPQRMFTTNALALVQVRYPPSFPPHAPPFGANYEMPHPEQFPMQPFPGPMFVGQPCVMQPPFAAYSQPPPNRCANDNRQPAPQMMNTPQAPPQAPSNRQAFMPLQVQRRQAHTNAQHRRQTNVSTSSVGAGESDQITTESANKSMVDTKTLSDAENATVAKEDVPSQAVTGDAEQPADVTQLASSFAETSLNESVQAQSGDGATPREKKSKQKSRIAALLPQGKQPSVKA